MNQVSSFLKAIVKMSSQYVLVSTGFVILISLISKFTFGSQLSYYFSLFILLCLSVLTLTQLIYPSDLGSGLKSYSIKYFESLPFSKSLTLSLIALVNVYISIPIICHALILGFQTGKLNSFNMLIMVAEIALTISAITFLIFGLALFANNAKSKNLDSISMVVYLLKCAGVGGVVVSSVIAFETLMTLLRVSLIVEWMKNLKLTLSSFDHLFSLSSLSLILLVTFFLFVGVKSVWSNHKLLYWTFKPVRRNFIEASLLILATVGLSLFCMKNKTNVFSGNDLTVAIHKQDKSLVNKLGKLTDFYDKESSFGITPLMAALLVKDCESFKFLQTNKFKNHKPLALAGSSLNGVNIVGLAASVGCTASLESLLGAEFKIDQAVHKSGWTALHLASKYCQPELAESLLRWGANPNETDEKGNTPLFFSTRVECHAVNHLLKTYDADFRITNVKGERPEDWLPKNASPSSVYFYRKQANL